MDDLLWKFTDDSVKMSSTFEGFKDYSKVGPVSFGGNRYVDMSVGANDRNAAASFLELQGSRITDQFSAMLFGAFCSGKTLGTLTIVKLMNVDNVLKIEEQLDLVGAKFSSYNKMLSAQGGQDTFTIAYTAVNYTYWGLNEKNVYTKYGPKGYVLSEGKMSS